MQHPKILAAKIQCIYTCDFDPVIFHLFFLYFFENAISILKSEFFSKNRNTNCLFSFCCQSNFCCSFRPGWESLTICFWYLKHFDCLFAFCSGFHRHNENKYKININNKNIIILIFRYFDIYFDNISVVCSVIRSVIRFHSGLKRVAFGLWITLFISSVISIQFNSISVNFC